MRSDHRHDGFRPYFTETAEGITWDHLLLKADRIGR